MQVDRGMAGSMPYAATGSGAPVVVLAGGWPTTGVDSERLVRGAFVPLRRLARTRRLVVINRRRNLPAGMDMGELAAEHAEALGAEFGPAVDVLGTSTGGSIAQQLAADHPHAVRRLVLLSTACRLGPAGRAMQARVAALLREGDVRAAAALAGADLAPRGFRTIARCLAWGVAPKMIADPTTAADLATTLEAEDGFDLARCARPIQAKTLIVAGGRDRFYGEDLFGATAALIPDSSLRVFPRRGHISVASDPRAQATIGGFLS